MWFNILLGNHGEGISLLGVASLVEHLRQSLGACGHSVTISNKQLQPSAINLFLENFQDGAVMVEQFQTWRKFTSVGIIASELMVNGVIPYAAHGIKQSQAQIASRIDSFEKILSAVDFAWFMLERTFLEYQHRVPMAAWMPFGYLEIPEASRNSPKNIDVVFIGKKTPHREKILLRLQNSGLKVEMAGSGFPTGWQTDMITRSMLDQARIGLNLTLHGEDETVQGIDPRFASCTRIPEMVNRHMCVVSEDIPLDNPYRPYMVNAPVEELAAVCQGLIAGDSWREQAYYAHQLYRQEMSPQRIIGPVVDKTVRYLAGIKNGV